MKNIALDDSGSKLVRLAIADFKVKSMTTQTLKGRDESRCADNPRKFDDHNSADS
jgi:hypothetical protein